MTLFLISLAVLIGGYFVYGALVERIFGVDSMRPTPVTQKADGVDYVKLPTWKVFLIQFLNIAGVGPIFGAIMGVMYGPMAFLWIVLATIFAGAVHDFTAAMISLRSGGQSLPEIVGRELGAAAKGVMGVFALVLLVMVVAVFVRTPASLLTSLTPDWMGMTMWVVVIFIYYIVATLLPVDKVIGNIYPVFGFALLFMAFGLLVYLLIGGATIDPQICHGLGNRMPNPAVTPLFPMMFVSIACGAISGFHATQSPMMARCLNNERHARPVFYGAMVAEGIVALVWAASAIAFTGGYDNLIALMAEHNNDAGWLVKEICSSWLGIVGGVLAILGVIAAPITTGDTAMRSARLMVADALKIDQHSLLKRVLVALPIIAASWLLMQIDFTVLWRYFAWSNQSLSVFTLWACAVYLARRGRCYWITLIPAIFMTFVCSSYILFAPLGTPNPDFGLSYNTAVSLGGAIAAVCTALFARWQISNRRLQPLAD